MGNTGGFPVSGPRRRRPSRCGMEGHRGSLGAWEIGHKVDFTAKDGATMRRLTYDLLVIGAGPGGSTAARYAAAAGCRTLLIEKRTEIGTPVRCGEGVAKAWLTEIGVPPSEAFIANSLDRARVVAPDGSAFTVDERLAGNEVGYVLERDLFDRHLAMLAAQAGADIRVHCTATELLREDGRVVGARCIHMGEDLEVRAPIVIGADGFESQVGRWAGLATPLKARDIEACLQYTLVGIEGDPTTAEFYLGSCAPGGYAWVFWKGAGIANVGLGANLSRLKDKAEVKGLLDRFIAANPRFAKGRILEEVAGAVSVSPPLEKTVADGLMLVGDAARLIDPVTGGGILNACLSGKYAGEVAAAAVAAKDFTAKSLGEYERRWRGRLEEGLHRNYLIKERLLKMDDATISLLIRALSEFDLGHVTALDVLQGLRKKHPELLAHFSGLV